MGRDTTRDDLKDLFRKFGKIREISLKKGYAFVEFYDRHDADDAIEKMDGEKIDGGNRLVVERAGERKSRRSSRGPQANDKCFKCGDRGHWANECKRSSRRRRHSSSEDSSSRSRSNRRKYKRRRHRSSSDSSSRSRRRGRSPSSESSRSSQSRSKSPDLRRKKS